MSQNIVYKTFELNTDIEHKAKPINLSGASTIKLTDIPSGVKCWISTESNGTNLYPLINRGDGWVNLPSPLYDLYIYTQGTTVDNQKIILNYTGQNDFFVYGNNSSERVDKVGLIEGFSKKALIDINNAINNYYTLQEPIITGFLQGELNVGYRDLVGNDAERYVLLPFGYDTTIKDFNLENDKYYRIKIIGHFDIGSTDNENDSGIPYAQIYGWNRNVAHLAIYKDSNNAEYSQNFASNLVNQYETNQLFKLNKPPYANKRDVFDIYGMKYIFEFMFWRPDAGNPSFLRSYDKGLNIGTGDMIFKGEILNKYDRIGVLLYFNAYTSDPKWYNNPSCHSSLMITISHAEQNFIGAK